MQNMRLINQGSGEDPKKICSSYFLIFSQKTWQQILVQPVFQIAHCKLSDDYLLNIL